MRATILLAVLMLQAPVPVEQEPRHTTVHLDDGMRVLEVNIPYGDTSLEHAHRFDIATVCVECSDTQAREPGADWGPVRKRAVGSWQVTEYRKKPGAHTVRTIAPGAYHLIAVENLRGSGFDVKEHRLPADGALAPHTHARATVAVTLPAGTWRVVPPATSHAVVAAGQPLHVVEIELR
jgi:hypothetical protein